MDAIADLLRNLQTERVIEWMESQHIGDLIHNPYFLGGVAVFAIICLLMKWRGLLATCLGVTGFAYLISYTLQRGTQIDELSNPTLLVFVGGGVVLIGLVIYLLFIKSE